MLSFTHGVFINHYFYYCRVTNHYFCYCRVASELTTSPWRVLPPLLTWASLPIGWFDIWSDIDLLDLCLLTFSWALSSYVHCRCSWQWVVITPLWGLTRFCTLFMDGVMVIIPSWGLTVSIFLLVINQIKRERRRRREWDRIKSEEEERVRV